MFEAFNGHNVERLMSFFSDDLEFYHDKAGLTDKPQTRETFAKVFAQSPDIRRDLVKGSLRVYPVKGYGAMEVGQHRFCHHENGKEDCGTYTFVMIWRQKGDIWQISRVVSYGH